MENGDYLLLGPDRDENIREIMRHSVHDADAMDRYEHDVTRIIQLVSPLFDRIPPNIFGKSEEDFEDIAWLLGHLGSAEPSVVHNAVRLITGSISDFLDDYFESEVLKGYLAASSTTGTKVGPMSAGSGLVSLMMTMGEHDGPSARGRSTRAATAGSRSCWHALPRRTARRSASSPRSTTSSPTTDARPVSCFRTARSSTPTSW